MSITPTTVTPAPRKRRRRRLALALGVGVALLVVGALFVHPFLAVTVRVDADVLVVEGWVPDHVLAAAAAELHQGGYTYLLSSGVEFAPGENNPRGTSFAAYAAERLVVHGADPARVIACPAPFATRNRTSSSARAVREKLRALGVTPRGLNVVTAGPHARETWVAYEHIMGNGLPVGIISIPKTNYDAAHWWTSRDGLIWVPKDFAGWLKEVLFGARS